MNNKNVVWEMSSKTHQNVVQGISFIKIFGEWMGLISIKSFEKNC